MDIHIVVLSIPFKKRRSFQDYEPVLLDPSGAELAAPDEQPVPHREGGLCEAVWVVLLLIMFVAAGALGCMGFLLAGFSIFGMMILSCFCYTPYYFWNSKRLNRRRGNDERALEPLVEQAPLPEPMDEQRPLEEPMNEQRPLEEPMNEQRPLEEPMNEQRPLEEPVNEQRPLEEPLNEQRPLEEPVNEQRPLEEPGNEQRPLEEPVNEQRPQEKVPLNEQRQLEDQR